MGLLAKLLGREPVYEPQYHFNVVYTPQPGVAYQAPLIQFQTQPSNRVLGAGTQVQRPFASYESQWLQQPLQPVTGGNSGTLTGQVFSQPLTDTTQNSGSIS